MPKAPDDHAQEIEAIAQRLQVIEYEKSQLLSRKAELESRSASLIATSSTLSPHTSAGREFYLYQAVTFAGVVTFYKSTLADL